MKTTFQTTGPARRGESRPAGYSVNNAPVTDWSFQPESGEVRGGSAAFHHPHPANGFRGLSQEYFEEESKRSYGAEAIIFGIIASIALWPIVLAAQAAFALIK